MGKLTDSLSEAIAWVDANSGDDDGSGIWHWEGGDPTELRGMLLRALEAAGPCEDAAAFLDLAPATARLRRENYVEHGGTRYRVGDEFVSGGARHVVLALGDGTLYYQGDGPVTFVPASEASPVGDQPTDWERSEAILARLRAGGVPTEEELAWLRSAMERALS